MTPFVRRLAGVFVLALCVRVVHTAAVARAPFSRLLVGDGKGYDRWAATIAAGDWVGKETFYQAPLYPYALAGLYTVAGRDPMTVRWVQALAGALACVFLALAGRRFVSDRAGLIAGALLAVYPPAVFFDGLVQKASLDNLLMCALLAVLGAYVATRRAGLLVVAGAVLGLFALTRENALVFFVILAAWLPFELAADSLKVRWTAIGLLAAGMAVVLIPVGLRNQAVGGDFLITTSQAGSNFFIGNHEGATGRYLPLRPDHETYEFERLDAKELAEQAAGHALTPGAVSSYWWNRSFLWIGAHPGEWLGLLGKKVLLTWNRAELPDSESLEIYADHSALLAALSGVFGFGLLVALAVPGMALAWRLTPRPWLLYLMLFGFSFAVAAFYVFARYRFPMVPILALFAGTTVAAVAGAAHAKAWPKPHPSVVWAAIAGVGLMCIPPVVPATGSLRMGYVNLAIGCADAGDFQTAEIFYRKAIALAPGLASPHRDLAVSLVGMGRIDEAVRELETALRLDPQSAPAHDDLGGILVKRGDFAGAERHFREALRFEPTRSTAAANLGGVALGLGHAEEAVDWYSRAIELEPAKADYHYQLAVALSQLDRRGETARELATTIRLNPDSAAAHDDLGVLLAQRGDFGGAEREFREAYRLDPSRTSTLFNLGGVAMAQKHAEDAVGWYLKALVLKPDFAQARVNLEAAQRELGIHP